MPVTCDLVRQATQGLQGASFNRLISALGAFAAADTGLKAGTGGQVGVTDLPGLFNKKGIECYSPELGDSIWVTPLQWYANGMSCDGLRDPEREELQKKIEEFEKRKENSKKLPSQVPLAHRDILPDLPKELLKDLQDIGRGNINFTASGILSVQQKLSRLYDTGQIFNYPEVSFNFTVNAGDRLNVETRSDIILGDISINEKTNYYANQLIFYSSTVPMGMALIAGYFYQRISFTNREPSGQLSYFSTFSGDNTVAKVQFVANNPESPPTISIAIEPPKTLDPETPCDMGCSCKDISRLVVRQQQTDQSLRRLIQEIHRATAAGLFASGTAQFSPEQRIEQIGKQIYSQSPGRGGKVPVKNLLEATTALIAAEYHRLGLHKFPANVPKELIPNPNAALEAIDRDFIDIHTLADYLEWNTKIDDERLGQWPIEFEVTDDGKKKKVYLWNVAEALGDIFGALIKVVEDSDIGVQWGIRSSVEASKAGNAALKSLHLLKEFVKFSGALTQDDILKVQSTFTPDPMVAQSTEDMLKPSAQHITVTNIVDKRSLLGLLLNISYWTQISGRSVYGDLTNNPATRQPNMPGDGIREMRRRSRVTNKRWDEWRQKRQQRRNISVGDQPPGGMQTPDIKDISPQR